MGSWDRMVVPYPFSPAIFLYGDPILISREDDVEAARLRVERAMNLLAEEADSYFSVTPTLSVSEGEGPGGAGTGSKTASRTPGPSRSLADARDDSTGKP